MNIYRAGEDFNRPTIALFARRRITKSEELSISYSGLEKAEVYCDYHSVKLVLISGSHYRKGLTRAVPATATPTCVKATYDTSRIGGPRERVIFRTLGHAPETSLRLGTSLPVAATTVSVLEPRTELTRHSLPFIVALIEQIL